MKKLNINILLVIGILFGGSILINFDFLRPLVNWSENQGRFIQQLDFSDTDTMRILGNNMLDNQVRSTFVNLLSSFEAITFVFNKLYVFLSSVFTPFLEAVNSVGDLFRYIFRSVRSV